MATTIAESPSAVSTLRRLFQRCRSPHVRRDVSHTPVAAAGANSTTQLTMTRGCAMASVPTAPMTATTESSVARHCLIDRASRMTRAQTMGRATAAGSKAVAKYVG